MAIVDLRNLSELLAEEPDLTDAPNAIECPPLNANEPDVAVEFDNVCFRYPSQTEGQGLTGVSFKMKRGTTTAIVGSTGAGTCCALLNGGYIRRIKIHDNLLIVNHYINTITNLCVNSLYILTLQQGRQPLVASYSASTTYQEEQSESTAQTYEK